MVGRVLAGILTGLIVKERAVVPAQEGAPQ